jgi:hypothetical protein
MVRIAHVGVTTIQGLQGPQIHIPWAGRRSPARSLPAFGEVSNTEQTRLAPAGILIRVVVPVIATPIRDSVCVTSRRSCCG